MTNMVGPGATALSSGLSGQRPLAPQPSIPQGDSGGMTNRMWWASDPGGMGGQQPPMVDRGPLWHNQPQGGMTNRMWWAPQSGQATLPWFPGSQMQNRGPWFSPSWWPSSGYSPGMAGRGAMGGRFGNPMGQLQQLLSAILGGMGG